MFVKRCGKSYSNSKALILNIKEKRIQKIWKIIKNKMK